MRELLHAFKRAVLTIGAGVVALAVYFGGQGTLHELGRWEARLAPVLATISVCDGRVSAETGECSGAVVVFDSFRQTGASCDGRDAIVAGVMSKVRSDATYIDGRQQVYYGQPGGPMRRTFFEFMDQQAGTPTNRPPGVQEWGPWRLVGGCVTEFTTWYSTVEHRPWHRLWSIPTVVGPFDLPRARIEPGVPAG